MKKYLLLFTVSTIFLLTACEKEKPKAPYTITQGSYTLTGTNDCSLNNGNTGSSVDVYFDMDTVVAQDIDHIKYKYQFSSGNMSDYQTTTNYSIGQNNTRITLARCIRFSTSFSIDYYFTVVTPGGLETNEVKITVARPAGAE